MIVDAIFNAIAAILGAVFSALPTMSLSSVLTPALSAGDTVGRYMAIGNGFLPLDAVVGLAHDVYALLLPALVTYKVANWVWRHIPEMWGFGPGAG